MLEPQTMAGDFNLDFLEAAILRFEPTGLWSHVTVDRWEAAFDAMIACDRARDRRLGLLVDLRKRAPHTQEIAARVQAGIARFSSSFAKVGIVFSASALMGMQSRRISPGSPQPDAHQRHFNFDEFDAARDWLRI